MSRAELGRALRRPRPRRLRARQGELARTAFSPEHSPSRAQLAQSVFLSLQMPAYTSGPKMAQAMRRRDEAVTGCQQGWAQAR